MQIELSHVAGADRGAIVLFALSTCAWCRRARALLDSLGVAYDYVYVDLLRDADQDRAMDELQKWNPRRSFPTVVFRGETAVTGFDEQAIRKALG